jgi:hypothetical protein
MFPITLPFGGGTKEGHCWQELSTNQIITIEKAIKKRIIFSNFKK